ncbi:MAG: hypothetical protein MUF15_28500 [Acidobacteria bacterium]|nr:hypothetical protein [Acidobacteriota bacterium]
MKLYSFDPCCKCKTDIKIVLKDKGKTKGPQFIGQNPQRKEILEVKVDHCLPIEGKKCDYVLISKYENTAHFIELKGNKIKEALAQLENSVKQISNPEKGFISNNFNQKYAYVIPSQYNPKLTTEIQRTQKRFKRDYQTELIVKNNKCEVKL